MGLVFRSMGLAAGTGRVAVQTVTLFSRANEVAVGADGVSGVGYGVSGALGGVVAADTDVAEAAGLFGRRALLDGDAADLGVVREDELASMLGSARAAAETGH